MRKHLLCPWAAPLASGSAQGRGHLPTDILLLNHLHASHLDGKSCPLVAPITPTKLDSRSQLACLSSPAVSGAPRATDSSRPPQMPHIQPEAIGSTHSNEAEKTTAMKQVGELDEATITVSSVAVTQKVSLAAVGERIKWPARARKVFLQ